MQFMATEEILLGPSVIGRSLSVRFDPSKPEGGERQMDQARG